MLYRFRKRIEWINVVVIISHFLIPSHLTGFSKVGREPRLVRRQIHETTRNHPNEFWCGFVGGTPSLRKIELRSKKRAHASCIYVRFVTVRLDFFLNCIKLPAVAHKVFPIFPF